MQFSKSQKNKNILINDDFIYNFKKQNKESQLWTCRNRDCPGRLKLFCNSEIQITPHNHQANPEDVLKHNIDISIKENAKNTTYSTRDVFSKIVLEKNLITQQKRKTIYNNINNARKKELHLEEDSSIPLHLKFTFNKEKFLFVERENKFKIFSTEKNLEYLQLSSQWITDGTFLAAPFGFEQVYILYGFIFKKCVPLVYIIMTSRTEEDYLEVLKEIKKKCRLINLQPLILTVKWLLKMLFLKYLIMRAFIIV